jgi:hypothetical protein
MATRLSLYNGALLECGERDLASLSENREPRRLLDRVWDNGLVDYVLGKGQWKFGLRAVQLAPETSIEPDFGYQLAYAKPTDHIRTTGLYSDEYANSPLLRYTFEQGYVFTDTEPLFWHYVSNDDAYGGNLAEWPVDFSRAVEVYMASRIVKKLTQSDEKEANLIKLSSTLFRDAASSDAMEGPTKFLPPGTWVSARVQGSRGTRGDRGLRGRLIG